MCTCVCAEVFQAGRIRDGAGCVRAVEARRICALDYLPLRLHGQKCLRQSGVPPLYLYL